MNPDFQSPLIAKIKGLQLPPLNDAWRDQLIFAAGQATAQRKAKPWMGPACLAAGLMCGLLVGRWPLRPQIQENTSETMVTGRPQPEAVMTTTGASFCEVTVVPTAEVTAEARKSWQGWMHCLGLEFSIL
ncbi:MAG: hypothetical protein EBS30_15170 [Planctomycetes bacterium]|nr:hypothetical protein [Planctomycetota bacterium]